MLGQVPPSRTPSTLTSADSSALATAALRAALGDPAREHPPCILGIASNLRTAAGKAFEREGAAHVAAMRAIGATSRDSYLKVALAGFRDGDTATVLVNVDGGDARASYENYMDYYFVRGTPSSAWRLVAHGLAGASDYVVTPGQPERPRPACLNGTAR